MSFDRPDAQRREIAKYWVFEPFWPRAARHFEKFRAKNGKTRFPGARGTFGEKICPPHKFVPKTALLLFHFVFWPTGRPGAGNREIRGSGPFWPRAALGTERISGPKTEKRDFPELGALVGGKTVRPKSLSQKLRDFFTFCVLAHRTPRGGHCNIRVFWTLLA